MVRSLISSRGRVFSTTGRSMFRSIFRPTIHSVSSCSLVWAVSTVVIYSPLRRMATRSDSSITSFNLWVMMMMECPSSRIRRRTANSFSISCTVSTAVGSSRMMTLAP